MDMTPDQMVEFLVGAFKDIERETLLLVLQANDYNLDTTLETLMEMESGDQSNRARSEDHLSSSTPNPGAVLFDLKCQATSITKYVFSSRGHQFKGDRASWC